MSGDEKKTLRELVEVLKGLDSIADRYGKPDDTITAEDARVVIIARHIINDLKQRRHST